MTEVTGGGFEAVAEKEKTGLYVSNDGSQRAKEGSGKCKGRTPRMEW